ncbi:serine/threonine-protein kinase TBK1-like [Mytilus galloprovincialis]|uniref:serine/threonine-protein kinase TBK1-like n=1 Tax=Mytilus galloprovincialis TaxID=29158 RepID=UPI003F7B61F7
MEHKKAFLDTENHVYSLEDLIGRGAQGNIYKGIHKSSGEVHALKMFEKYNLQTQREMDALSKLQHPNIVMFYKCEKDSKKKEVIVMELCEGGSLLDSIRKPENITGLEEEEFLRVFSHLVSGMKHLRKHGFSHRDIKPGNILVCIGEDSRNIYKLSDFGTAKPLNDNDFFVSLVGTDEYLHPDIYKAAFIDRRRGGGSFTISADLWSLGATLYHTVTGKVPFSPYIGRDDKNVMFEMISEKESGVISGEQMSAGGSIHWSKNLPKTCRLSKSMNTCVKTILINLLESDKTKIWSFEDFFDAADELMSRKPVYVFYPNTCTRNILYVKQETNFRELKDMISSETDITHANQFVLYSDNHLNNILSETDCVFPNISTDYENPLIILDVSNKEEIASINYEPWEHAVFDEPMPCFELTERTVYDINRDYQVAKIYCAKMFLMEKIIKKLELFKKLLQQTVGVGRKHNDQKLDVFSRELSFLQQRLSDISSLTEHSKKEKFTAITKEGDEAEDDTMMTKARVQKCEKVLLEISGLYTEEKKLFPGQKPCANCLQNNTDSERKVRRHIVQSEELLKKFAERRSQRMTVHIEYMHNFDRKNILEHSKEIQKMMTISKTELEKEHSDFIVWNRYFKQGKKKSTELDVYISEAGSSIDDLIQTFKELSTQEPPLPAIGEKTLKRKQFITDVNLRVEDIQRNVMESKLIAVQSREQLDSLSSLMSDFPSLEDVDYTSLSNKSDTPLTNGVDTSLEKDMSILEDLVDCKR